MRKIRHAPTYQMATLFGVTSSSLPPIVIGMKPAKITAFLVFLLILMSAGAAQAGTSYTWTGGSANWSEPSKWDVGTSYPGQNASDDTVTFNGNQGTVTIDISVTVATVNVTGSQNWTWTNSGVALLTLGTSFTYGSSGSSSALNAPMAGTGQVIVTAGRIDFNNTNSTFTGNTTVKGGTLGVYADNALGTGGTLYLGDTGGTSNNAMFYLTGSAGSVLSRPIYVQSGNAGLARMSAGTWGSATDPNRSFPGTLTLDKDISMELEYDNYWWFGSSISGTGAIVYTPVAADRTTRITYQSLVSPTFSGGTRISANNYNPGDANGVRWWYFPADNTSTTLWFGNGPITLSKGKFEISLGTSAGSGTGNVTVTNAVTITSQGGGLGAWGDNNKKFAATFSGPISLGGPMVVGSIMKKFGAGRIDIHYTGKITIDQSIVGVRSIKKDDVQNGGGGDSRADLCSIEGSIVDGAGGATNPLTIGNAFTGIIVMASATATYTNGTVISTGLVCVGSSSGLGVGPVTVLAPATMRFTNSAGASDWTFTNDLRGWGGVQVESGTNTTKTLTLSGCSLTPGSVGAVGNLTVNGQLALAAAGPTKASLVILANGTNVFTGANGSNSYSRLNVKGNSVDLGGQTLRVVLGYVPAYSDAMYILLNDGTDAIVNTFDQQPDLSRVMCQGPNNRYYLARITYAADGDGSGAANDIMLSDFSIASQGTVLIVR